MLFTTVYKLLFKAKDSGGNMKIKKDIINFTIPIIMEQTFVLSLGTINAIMAGHLGKEAVSAIGMINSINTILISFFTSLAVGGTVVIAQYYGQKNIKTANDSLKQILYAGTLISVIITLLIWIFRYGIMHFLFGSAEVTVINYSLSYLGVTLISYPFIAAELIICGALRGIGNTKTPMKLNVIMNIINVFTSYILIFGINLQNSYIHIVFTGKGVIGAAIGIAIARLSGAILALFILIKGTSCLKLNHPFKFKPDKLILKSIFCISIPASLESLLFNGGKLITQIFIVALGTEAIAANYIADSVAALLEIPGNAFCIASTAIVGQHFGRGNIKEAKASLVYITKLSTICLTGIGLLCFPFSKILVSLYTQDSSIISISAQLLRIFCFFMLTWSPAFVLSSGLKGAGDAKYTLISSIVGMWAFRIALGYIFCVILRLGVNGIWLGMYIDWIVRGILFIVRIHGNSWKRHTVISTAR